MRQHEKNDRPEAYPKPTETDQQLKNQPEYIEQKTKSLEKDISDVPTNDDRQQDWEQKSDVYLLGRKF